VKPFRARGLGAALGAGLLVLASAGCASVPAGGSPDQGSPTGSSPPPPPPDGSSIPAATVDLAGIRAEIEARYMDQLIGIGFGAAAVVVNLKPTATAVAAEIAARYGDSVQLSVGFFPYPPPSSPPNPCTAYQPTLVDPSALRATIVLSTTRLTHEVAFRGKVRLTNGGAKAVDIATGQPYSIYLFTSGGKTIIGAAPGGVAGTGLEFTLAPGSSREIDAAGGTASCDLALGYELPDGAYVARALVELDQSTGPGFMWSDPLAVQLLGSNQP
jgi:hypothetical protein